MPDVNIQTVQGHQVVGHLTLVTVNHHAQRKRKPPKPVPQPRATPEHRQVLTLMDRLPDRIAVLEFMKREFGTRMVIELEPMQVYRLRRYVEVVLDRRVEK